MVAVNVTGTPYMGWPVASEVNRTADSCSAFAALAGHDNASQIVPIQKQAGTGRVRHLASKQYLLSKGEAKLVVFSN
jgi:hypothetical protein